VNLESANRPDTGPPADDGFHVLLVEDDLGDIVLVEEMLADTGLRHTLTVARSLAEALDRLGRESCDCVLLDLHLPDASGLPLLRAVQQTVPDAAVIVLTGLADPYSGEAAVAAGAQDYLSKGQVDAQIMRRALRYAVSRKLAERATSELMRNQLRAEENVRLERGLLPAPLLDSPRVRATTRYLPSREAALLGGDFLDIVQDANGAVHAVIGDVSGHGPDEAALGVCLRITWRALTLAGHRDLELLALLEQVLVAERTHPAMFATCTILSVDPHSGTASAILAGHHEPLLISPTKAEKVPAKYGMALGIAPGHGYWHRTEFAMPATGALLLYTDGLIEGHVGQDGERLGMTGLEDLITEAPPLEPGDLLDHLIAAAQTLNADRHADDVAILHLAW
jgi:serine phosphatase RsbU (regulator of sigma subunit)